MVKFSLAKPSCLLAAGFILAHFATMLFTKDSPLQQAYMTSLSTEQKTVYRAIEKERQSIYFQGLALGTILAGLFLLFSPVKGNTQTCLFVLIIMGSAFFYYLLKPKEYKLMVTYLDTQAQRDLWQKVYKEYQMRYYGGFLLGVVGYALVGNLFA